jgi:hypothetical protein
MAYPKTRSLQAELAQGEIDGTYKQVNPDRGGVVEVTTWESRKDLSPRLYGITETPDKELPDGSGKVTSPYAVDAPLADIDKRGN